MREQHNLPGNQGNCRKIWYWTFNCSLIYSFNKSLLSLGLVSGSVPNAGNTAMSRSDVFLISAAYRVLG